MTIWHCLNVFSTYIKGYHFFVFCVVKSFQNNDIAIKTQAQSFQKMSGAMIAWYTSSIYTKIWILDASIARKTGTYRNHTQSFSSLWPRRRIELCAHFPFPPSSRQPLPSDLKGPDNPRHPLISTMELCIFLRTWVWSLTCLVAHCIMFWRPDWFDSGRWICLLQSCWYCVTRAFLYFIGSWVALSFKVCESVRHR